MSLFAELKRRSVFRVAIGYVGVAWLVIQVVETLFSIYGIDDSVAKIIVNVLIIGFVPAMVLAWVFELTPEGIKRDSEADHTAPAMRDFGRRLDRIALVVLSLAVAYFAIDKFWPSGPVGPSIAVVPFANASGDPTQDAFAAGMTKQMRSMLTTVRELRVIAEGSVNTLIEQGVDRKTMADQLRLTHFLEGSIQTVGSKVRVTAELVDVADDALVWSAVFDRQLGDVFAIQDEIAAQVMAQLDFADADPPAPSARTVDIEAFKLFVRADQLVQTGASSGTAEDRYREAVALLQQAVDIEPGYVDAWLDLSLASYRLYLRSEKSDENALSLADEAFERARVLDPRHPVVLSYLAYGAFEAGAETQEAASLWERAINAAPTNPDVIRPAQLFIRSIARFDKALAMAELAVDRDPKCADCWYVLSQILRDVGRHDESERAAEVAVALGYDLTFSIAITRLYQHDAQPMLAYFDGKGVDNAQAAWAYALALFSAGREAEFDAVFRRLREDFVGTNGKHLAPHRVAMVYAWSGRADEAFTWLEAAVEQARFDLQVNYRSPFLFNLHGDRRWDDVLRRIERHPEQLAKIRFDPKIPAVSR